MKALPPIQFAIRVIILPAVWLLFEATALGVGVSVTPNSITNLYNGALTLQITGLNSGETVHVTKYIDSNANGAVDSTDFLVQSFSLTDGQGSPVIGGVTNINIPGDLDSTSGSITARLTPGTEGLAQLFAGHFIWVVSSPSGRFAPVTTTTTVTPSYSGQTITGQVTSHGTNVPYAMVLVVNPSSHGGINPRSGWTADATGSFNVGVAPGTYFLMAAKKGFVADTTAIIPTTVPASGSTNVPLALLPATNTISGQFVDASNSQKGIPAILMGGGSSTGLFGISGADTNGNFVFTVDAGEWGVGFDSDTPNILGYLGLNNSINVDASAGSVSGVSIALPSATALIYGSIQDNQNLPIPGVRISGSYGVNGNGDYSGDAVSDGNGNYVIGVNAGLWSVNVETSKDPALAAAYLFSQGPLWTYNNGGSGTNIVPGIAVQANFVALRTTQTISGSLHDDGGNPLSNIDIYAYTTIDGQGFNQDAITDANGNYTLHVANGDWSVGVNCGCNDCDNSLGSNYNCPNNQDVPINNNNGTANFIAPICRGVQILTTNVPDAQPGSYYDSLLFASSCNQNFFWNLISGSLPPGLNFSANGEISGTPSGTGNFTFRVQVTDGNNNSAVQSLSINVSCPEMQIITTSLPSAHVGDYYDNQLSGNGCSQNLTWSIISGSLPSGLTMNTGGEIYGYPSTAGVNNFTVQATDDYNDSVSAPLSISVQAQVYQITGSITDPSNHGVPNIIVSATSGGVTVTNVTNPSGYFSIAVSNGSWDVVPECNSLAAAGYACVNDQIVQINGSGSGLSFSVSPCGPLQITTSSLNAGIVGTNYSSHLLTSGCNPPFTWSLTPGSLPLPQGLSLSGSGALTGIPTAAAPSYFSLRVTDGLGATADQLLSVAIYPPLVITNSVLPNADLNVPYNFTLTAVGGGGSSWGAVIGALPPGLYFNGFGSIQGTPTQLGTFQFTVVAYDNIISGYSAQALITLSVVSPSLQITSSSLGTAMVGAHFSQQLDVSGGTAPYSWMVALGSQPLPSGLTLSSGGLLSGTTTNVGTFTVIIRVTDANSITTTRSMQLNVTGGPTITAPTLLNNGFQFTVNAAAGQNYTVQHTSTFIDWITLVVTNPLTPSFIVTDTNTTDQLRFYRILVGP
jgi:hypothetical protein